MNRRIHACAVAAGCLAIVCSSAFAVDPHPSVSASRQVLVYCDNPQARSRVASFADEMKTAVLNALGIADTWKFPIVITIEPAKTSAPRPLTEVRLVTTEAGFKIAVNVAIGGDMTGVSFQHDLVRAVLLELAYRGAPPVAGREYLEPPAWLVEAIVAANKQRQGAENADVFKTLVANGKVPPLRDFLISNPASMDATSRALFEAESLSLLQMLVELPNGRLSLASLVRDFPKGDNGDPAGNLVAHFPALAGSEQSLSKWWALTFARLANANRARGLSAEETEQRLRDLLVIELTQKDGSTKKFALEEFREYLKIPASHAALKSRVLELAAFSATAHALFRPIIVEYEKLLADIDRGKTRRVAQQLAIATTYREMVLTRLGDINDYLNWIEATQMPVESGAFKTTATPPSRKQNSRGDAISKYLDAMEKEVAD